MKFTLDRTILVLLFAILMSTSIGISLVLFNLYTYSWVSDQQGKKVISTIINKLDQISNESSTSTLYDNTNQNFRQIVTNNHLLHDILGNISK